jgi:hypothetical protein
MSIVYCYMALIALLLHNASNQEPRNEVSRAEEELEIGKGEMEIFIFFDLLERCVYK